MDLDDDDDDDDAGKFGRLFDLVVVDAMLLLLL